MSLPIFDPQASLFSTAALCGQLFAPEDRFAIFARVIFPLLGQARPELARAYCADNGRPGLEPVLMMGVSLLQFLEGAPDRQAVELLQYHAGWNFALNRAVGEPVFDPSALVYFRRRLVQHDLSGVVFARLLDGLVAAGLVQRRGKQRLDSTQMMGLLSWMSRLENRRETLRLALQELEQSSAPLARPAAWSGWIERYVESKLDYRSTVDALKNKMEQAGRDALELLRWVESLSGKEPGQGQQVQLLRRVFEENFQVTDDTLSQREAQPAGAVHNPHEPEAQWAAKGRGKWNKTLCASCPLRERCLGQNQTHRTLLVGEHHDTLQARRQEQKTAAFREKTKRRNAIEGTQSELVRAHGLRHARYRGHAKTRLQNYFIGAACNAKRWIKRIQWQLRQTALGHAGITLQSA